MDKKILLGLILCVLIVAIAGVAYLGYQKGLFGGLFNRGIDKNSVMGMMKEKGETVMSKSEFINKCKESDKDSQDMCYAMGALYYRDASFCGLVKDSEAKKSCSKENIEKCYSDLKTCLSGFSGVSMPGGTIPGGGMFPDVIPDGEGDTGTGTIPGDGQEEEKVNLYDSATETVTSSARAKEMKSILSEACGEVKLTLHTQQPSSSGNVGDMLAYVWKNKPTEEKLVAVFEKNGYQLEAPGGILFFKKGNLTVEVDWSDQMDDQEIGVAIIEEE